MTFNETGLNEAILRAITEMGFINPTPIQEKTIPQILESKNDLVALAQTGTGKTAAFGLPVLQLTEIANRDVQTLVLCPTRELGLQITKDLQNYSKYIKGFKVVPVYGGAAIVNQIREVKAGAHVVVGTPGRTLDLIKRKVLKLEYIRWLILDEADEMLNMGFKEDLDAILQGTPASRQTLLFSATMPKEIERISKNYMKNPDQLSVGKRNAGADNVKHEYYMVRAKDRYETLKRVADLNPNIYGIVFCRTRAETKEVADKLMQDGYNADTLHGDLSQAQRDYVMGRFRQKHLQILVATDVAARGLDVNDLSHVINFNLPDDLEVYVHRSGRTGRAGKSGVSISIVHTKETGHIRELERMTQKKFEQKQVPDGRAICEKQLFHLVDIVENIHVDNHQIEQYLPVIYKKLEWLDREELIKHFVSVEFNRFLAYYKDAPDLNVKAGAERNEIRQERGGSRSRVKFARFHINIGTNNKANASYLLNMINDVVPGGKIEIGKIDILRNFSFFEADSNHEEVILKAFQNTFIGDLPIVVTKSKEDKAERDTRDRVGGGGRVNFPDKNKKRKRKQW